MMWRNHSEGYSASPVAATNTCAICMGIFCASLFWSLSRQFLHNIYRVRCFSAWWEYQTFHFAQIMFKKCWKCLFGITETLNKWLVRLLYLWETLTFSLKKPEITFFSRVFSGQHPSDFQKPWTCYEKEYCIMGHLVGKNDVPVNSVFHENCARNPWILLALIIFINFYFSDKSFLHALVIHCKDATSQIHTLAKYEQHCHLPEV